VTLVLWQACLERFQAQGTPNERLMSRLLLQIISSSPAAVEGTFDAVASEILEATS